jgi:hypothetical protein
MLLGFAMRVLILASFAVLTGCTDVCHPQVTNTAVVQRPGFEAEIDACNTQFVCKPLCADVFKIDASDIVVCEVTKLELSSATIKVMVNDPARCESGADDIYLDWGDDTGYEDDSGCDDGSCDDGTDDGSTDDGSTDDGSTDDGSTDDGSTDDGTTDAAHLHTTPAHTLAPKLR